MEGRGKGEKTYTYLSCHKTSRGLEAALNEDGNGWKEEGKKNSLCQLESRKITQNFLVSQCPTEGPQRLLPVTVVTE